MEIRGYINKTHVLSNVPAISTLLSGYVLDITIELNDSTIFMYTVKFFISI